MNQKGFTLTEILTAVIIVSILTVMAVPLYEKTVERSRLAEARTIMNRLQEAKWNAMDNMGCETYSSTNNKCPKKYHLNVDFKNDKISQTGVTQVSFHTKDFTYSLEPTSSYAHCQNGIMATRRGDGDTKGTVFVYYGLRRDTHDPVFACTAGSCETYGFETDSNLDCDK